MLRLQVNTCVNELWYTTLSYLERFFFCSPSFISIFNLKLTKPLTSKWIHSAESQQCNSISQADTDP